MVRLYLANSLIYFSTLDIVMVLARVQLKAEAKVAFKN